MLKPVIAINSVKKEKPEVLITPNEVLSMVGRRDDACESKRHTKDVFDVSGLQVKLPQLGEGSLLFLTNIRSFQQGSKGHDKQIEAIRQIKASMKDKPFRIRRNPPPFCGSFKAMIFQGINGLLEKVTIKHIFCNSWTCPDCCVKKALMVKYKLKQIIIDNNLDRFLTLTLKPSVIPEEYKDNTHKYITKLFNHFITVLKRKKFKYFDKKKRKYFTFDLKKSDLKLKYVWVIEYQKTTKNAHLHIVFNQYLPIIVLRKIWVHVGGGHSMKILKVRSVGGISSYITDYIVKGIKNDISNSTHTCYFRFCQKRYSVSRSCIRQKKMITIPFLSDYNLYQRLSYFHSLQLDSVYRHLNNLEYQGNILVKKIK